MISLLVPTRGRPSNMQRVWDTARETANSNNIEIIFYIDHDDKASIDKYLHMTELDSRVKAVVADRVFFDMSKDMYYETYKLSAKDIIWLGNDDFIFKTYNWYGIIAEIFNKVKDKILLVYGWDGFQNARMATNPFIHRNYIDVLGYICPPEFPFINTDIWLGEVVNDINRMVYINDLKIEHIHPIAGKAQYDKIYTDKEEFRSKVQHNFYKLGELRNTEKQKLLDFIKRNNGEHIKFPKQNLGH